MTEQELEIAKKIAEIERLVVSNLFGWLKVVVDDRFVDYNPFDWSILGPLMVKYGVNIEHLKGCVSANMCGSLHGKGNRHFII